MPWGWLKRGTDRDVYRWRSGRVWAQALYDEHSEVPRFGALRRDKTPTPACLNYRRTYGTELLLELFWGEERRALALSHVCVSERPPSTVSPLGHLI